MWTANDSGAALVADGNVMCRSSLVLRNDRRSSFDPQRGVGLDQTPLRVATTIRLGTIADARRLSAYRANPFCFAFRIVRQDFFVYRLSPVVCQWDSRTTKSVGREEPGVAMNMGALR